MNNNSPIASKNNDFINRVFTRPFSHPAQFGHKKHPQLSPRQSKRNQDLAQGFSHTGHLSVQILKPKEARPLLPDEAHPYLHADSLVFCLQEKGDKNHQLGFCIIDHQQMEAVKTANEPNAPKTRPLKSNLRLAQHLITRQHDDKNFLVISYLHIPKQTKMPRAKSQLLRAVADYCHNQGIDYILGQFAFHGKYPAFYARELSYLFHYCQIDKNFTAHQTNIKHDSLKQASMDIMPAEALSAHKARHLLPFSLRYFLRLGAKAGSHIVIDDHYNQQMALMHVFLIMPIARLNQQSS